MEKGNNPKKNCPYIRRLKFFAKDYIFSGVFIIGGGLFMYFCPQHLAYHQIVFLLILIGFGLLCIIKGIKVFIRIHKIVCRHQ